MIGTNLVGSGYRLVMVDSNGRMESVPYYMQQSEVAAWIWVAILAGLILFILGVIIGRVTKEL